MLPVCFYFLLPGASKFTYSSPYQAHLQVHHLKTPAEDMPSEFAIEVEPPDQPFIPSRKADPSIPSFLDLPPEIRQLVYECLFPWPPLKTVPAQALWSKDSQTGAFASSVHFAILATCRTVHAECRAISYRGTPFRGFPVLPSRAGEPLPWPPSELRPQEPRAAHFAAALTAQRRLFSRANSGLEHVTHLSLTWVALRDSLKAFRDPWAIHRDTKRMLREAASAMPNTVRATVRGMNVYYVLFLAQYFKSMQVVVMADFGHDSPRRNELSWYGMKRHMTQMNRLLCLGEDVVFKVGERRDVWEGCVEWGRPGTEKGSSNLNVRHTHLYFCSAEDAEKQVSRKWQNNCPGDVDEWYHANS